MKKLFLMLFVSAIFVACGDGQTTEGTQCDTTKACCKGDSAACDTTKCHGDSIVVDSSKVAH